jgi:hypothetical protein
MYSATGSTAKLMIDAAPEAAGRANIKASAREARFRAIDFAASGCTFDELD